MLDYTTSTPEMAPKRHPRRNREVQPLKVDYTINFDSIGGLEEHIKCLREMVLFPLIYPEFFKRFNTRPPKGVLFHGPPGTGKTLLARALAHECGLVRGKRVAFFMRKGADVMSRWYGESEKQINMLFKQAYKMRPSIIFFDEMDALAPIRSEGQGEAYASVVATLLVEMDGLCERGDVIVIGATNRLDSIDPALRRPGRFDRELFFPPPSLIARRDILSIYTRHWIPRPSEDILHHIASITNGYLGSDLNALCSESVLKALKRVYPQVYDGDNHRFTIIDWRKIEVTLRDLLAAKRDLLPSGARYTPMSAKHLPEHCEPLLKAQVEAAAQQLLRAFPVGELNEMDVVCPSEFLICGECAETHLAPALLAELEHCLIKELSMATLHCNHAYSQERAIISIFTECRRADRTCVLFMPSIGLLWEVLSRASCAALLLQLWRTRAAGDNVLLLATTAGDQNELPEEVQEVFPEYKACVYRVREPTASEVTNFLLPVVTRLPRLRGGDKADVSKEFGSMTMISPTEVIPRKRRYIDIFHFRDSKKPRFDKEISESISEDSYKPEEEKELCPDIQKLIITNAESLCQIGLETLTDLHTQLWKAAEMCCTSRDRLRLPQEFQTITNRYLKLLKK